MDANLIDAGGLWIEIIFFAYFLQFVGMLRQNNHHQSWQRQTGYWPMVSWSSGNQNQQIR